MKTKKVLSLKFKTLKSGDCPATVSLGAYKRIIKFTVQ